MGNYVYIVECADGTWYTGWTTDVGKRVRAHNEGKGAKYTRSRRPVSLVYAAELSTKQEAMYWEYTIKQMTREQKQRLVCESRSHMGKIYYLMGKSASGKDHIYEALLRDERLKALALQPLVIYTTRPMRRGETDGVTYHFADEAKLEVLEKQGRVIEKRCYETIAGPWYYFTVDDESTDLSGNNYLAIGTPEAYRKIRRCYGPGCVEALYVETEDGIRLQRALNREKKEETPRYEEMCRRFLADQKDFAPAKLKRAGITQVFENNGTLGECVDEIVSYILSRQDGRSET